jgi:Suppressor of fused protein (SUFU)
MSNPVFDQATQTFMRSVLPYVNEVMGGKEGWAECNVHARMKCQQPVVNMTVTKKQDGDETAIPQSLVPDFETSMGIMTAVSAMWSQMNEPGVGPAWSSIHFRFKDGSMSQSFEDVQPDEESKEDDKDHEYMEQVYDARDALFEASLCKGNNTEPGLIVKMNHLFVVWPMGGLRSFHNPNPSRYYWTTFGLTNPDMPATLTSKQVGRGTMLLPKDQKSFPRVGMAGYGYELIIMVDEESAEWPKHTLQWACNNELLGDINFLARVEALDGLTAANIPAAGDTAVNILIAPPYVDKDKKDGSTLVIPLTGELPNGRMKFLMLTIITEQELEYSLEHGRPALLKLLYEKGEGQLSRLNRPSVV